MTTTKLPLDIFVEKYVLDCEHSQEVWKYCEMILFALTDNVTFSDREKQYLRAAALLHDIGYAIEKKSHHKHTMKMILDIGIAEFSDEENFIIANIARYHRNSLPDIQNHEMFAKLSCDNRNLVCKLGGILRLADGFDKPHKNLFLRLRAEFGDSITFFIKTIGYKPSLKSAESKKDLFEFAFKKSVYFVFE